MKRLSADDSVHSHVKVGHRQALQFQKTPLPKGRGVFYCLKDFIWLTTAHEVLSQP